MELVRSTDFSVVTLVGPGSTGKTRLALAGTIKVATWGAIAAWSPALSSRGPCGLLAKRGCSLVPNLKDAPTQVSERQTEMFANSPEMVRTRPALSVPFLGLLHQSEDQILRPKQT